MGNVPKETHAVSVMTKPLATVAVVRDKKRRSSSPAPNSNCLEIERLNEVNLHQS